MPEVIDIPGVGPVEFPDSMSDGEKTAAAKRLHAEAVTAERKQSVLPPQPTAAASDADPYGANLLTRTVGAGRGVIGGIGQGIVSTLAGIGELAGLNTRTPEVEALTAPYSTASRIGKAAEQIAEFAIPGGAAAKATKGLGVLSRAGAQAATAGAVAATQDGDVSAATVPAVVAGAVPMVGAGFRKGAEALIRGRLPQNLEATGVTFPFDRRNQWTRDAATGFRYRPKPRPESALAREQWIRDEATDDVLSAGLRGNRKDITRINNLLGDVAEPTAAERGYFEQLSRILGTRAQSPFADLASAVLAPASMLRRSPISAAQSMDWFAGLSTPGAGTVAGTPALVQELFARELAKADQP